MENDELNSKVKETTRKFIQEYFNERFEKTRNSILVEKPFQKVAEHYITQNVPAYLRTRNALSSKPEAIAIMRKALDEFLYKIESKELGWQYVLKKDGTSWIKFFDEDGEHLIDYKHGQNNVYENVVITEELKTKNMLDRLISSLNLEESRKDENNENNDKNDGKQYNEENEE